MLRGVAVAALVAALGGGLAGQRPVEPADLVVLDARILTVDDGFRVAQALAVRDGRFVAVGSAAEVRARIGPTTRVIDGGGRTIIPGLIDSHVHALGVAAAEASQPFQNLRSIGELQDWIRAAAKRAPPDTWIWTPRVYPPRLRERRFPTRQELDAAAPNHPVAVDGALRAVAQHPGIAGRWRDPRVSGSPRRGDRQGRPRRADGTPAQRRGDARALPAQRIADSAAGHARAGAPAIRPDRHHERDRTGRDGRGVSGLRGAAARRPVARACDRDVPHPASRRRGPGRAVRHRPAVPVRQRR